MTKKTRKYTPEFKEEAIHLALSSPSVLSAAKDLGMPEATLHTWVDKARKSGEVIHPSAKQPVNIGELIE